MFPEQKAFTAFLSQINVYFCSAMHRAGPNNVEIAQETAGSKKRKKHARSRGIFSGPVKSVRLRRRAEA